MEFLKSLANEAVTRPPTAHAAHGHRTHVSKRHHFTLSTPLQALHVAVVMEMLSDELEVLSVTIGAPTPELRSAESILLSQENRPKVTVLPQNNGDQSISLVQHYTTVIPRRMLQGLHDVRYWTAADLQGRMAEIRLKANTPAGKYQKDRTFLQMVAVNTLQELVQSETFSQLNKMVEVEKNTLRGFWNTCLEIKREQARIKFLKEELKRVSHEKRVKMEELDKEIFKLNDQLLEQNRRSQLETKFVEKQVRMIVKRFKRAHRQAMQTSHEQIALSQKKLSLEFVVHYNIAHYLKEHIKESQELLTYWQDKYERDLPQLITAIEELVENRNRDIERSKYIYRVIARHEPIVLEYRRLKELEEEKRRKKERQIRASIKLQAWWRGTMVRNQIGPFGALFYYLKHPEKLEEEKAKKAAKGKKKK